VEFCGGLEKPTWVKLFETNNTPFFTNMNRCNLGLNWQLQESCFEITLLIATASAAMAR